MAYPVWRHNNISTAVVLKTLQFGGELNIEIEKLHGQREK